MDPYQTLLPIQQQLQRQSQSMSPQGQQSPQPAGYNNGTVPGGVASMIKALTDGLKQRQMQQQAAQGANTTTGGPSVGAPLSLAPPSGATPPANGLLGVQVPMNPSAGLPGMPNGIDPSMQGLFSAIPGQGG